MPTNVIQVDNASTPGNDVNFLILRGAFFVDERIVVLLFQPAQELNQIQKLVRGHAGGEAFGYAALLELIFFRRCRPARSFAVSCRRRSREYETSNTSETSYFECRSRAVLRYRAALRPRFLLESRFVRFSRWLSSRGNPTRRR